MKKFLKRSIPFLLPIAIIGSFEAFFPPNLFTNRPWEALLFKSSSMPFYPSQKLDMISIGDLCHHTSNEVHKTEYWETDILGYRNNEFIEKADILIIGDSFIVGSSVTQDSTLANVMMKYSNLRTSVYALAPANFDVFVKLLDQKIIKKPKLLIFSLVERNIPALFIPFSSIKKKFDTDISNTQIIHDKIKRRYFMKYIKARIFRVKGLGVEGTADSDMFFVSGKEQKYNDNYAKESLKSIQSYKSYCDNNGMDFLFLPIPNKETVYFDYVPFDQQPDNLLSLDSLLQLSGIKTINTLAIFNEYRETNSDLLYHKDDSHWNANGIKLIASELSTYIRKDNDIFVE